MRKWPKALNLWCVAAAVLVVDILVKLYVYYSIPPMYLASPLYPFGGIGVFERWHGIDFAITHVNNKGAAWGVFASLQNYLLYARILIIGGLLSYLVFVKRSTFDRLCLTLVTAGALGNVLDTFVYGHVVDMFYFILWGYSFPVFNIADISIFCGIALLLFKSLYHKVGKSKPVQRNA